MAGKPQALIVGLGIIGLSIGIALLKLNSKLEVTILENEPNLGFHASRRNSWVAQAGFSYSLDSLKAKFCREGNLALTNLTVRNNLDYKRTGKADVAQNSNQVSELVELARHGSENGVALELLESNDLPKFEPLAQATCAFLWSPSTSVADPSQVIKVMAAALVPEIRDAKSWKRYKHGISAQLVETKSGKLVQDFKIAKEASVFHVLNSVSPGWRSSLSFGSWIAS